MGGQFMKHVLRRVNEAAGPYQMFGELADVVRFATRDGVLIAEYIDELPNDYLHDNLGFRSTPRLVLQFVYGRSFSPVNLPSPGTVSPEFAEFSSFLHPRFDFFPGQNSSSIWPRQRPLYTHYMVEDVF